MSFTFFSSLNFLTFFLFIFDKALIMKIYFFFWLETGVKTT